MKRSDDRILTTHVGSLPRPGALRDLLVRQDRGDAVDAAALARPLTMQDLRAHRHLVVRESSPERRNPTSIEATQRWTVGQLSTSIEAARSGYGFAWLPEERIREELKAGTLKPLPLREGGELYAELYLIFADREHAGPATVRLAEMIREAVASECKRHAPDGARGAR